MYVSWRDCPVVMPQLQLVAVTRVMVTNGETETLSLTVSGDQLRIWDDNKGFIYHPGLYCK